MDLPMVKMAASEAQRHLREYLEAADKLSADDELERDVYRELARGRNVLDLVAALRLVGVDERKRPKLAIAPADAPMCHFRRNYGSGRFVFSDRRQRVGLDTGARQVIVPRGALLEDTATDLRAAVPQVPIRLRPRVGIGRYHLLWEAAWESVPDDPFLLRRVGRTHLFAIVAQWDLTDVERAVLAARYLPQ